MKRVRLVSVTAFVVLIAIIFLPIGCSSKGGSVEWSKTFGGSGVDAGYSVQQTSDGGFVIAGVTESFGAGDGDVYLIKTDASGNEVWSKTFGGSGFDDGRSVLQTSDGGFVIVGSTASSGGGVYLIKTDASGNEKWSKTLGGSGGNSVQQTSDGGFVITGSTASFNGSVYLIKTDTSGNQQWSKTFGGSGGNSVQQTSDGGFIIAGEISSNGQDVYLVKTDASGNQQWSKTFGGSGFDSGDSVQQTTDGGFVIAGCVHSSGAGWDVYLIKTDTLGNQQWSKTFGGLYDDTGSSVRQTSDGGFIIAGEICGDSYGGFYDAYLIKTDASGNHQWSKTFGGSGVDYGISVQQISDGGYIVVGSTQVSLTGDIDVYFVKIGGE